MTQLKTSRSTQEIVVTGARTHNLKGVDVRIRRNQLVVITGPSGSGKSSLAFDTLYAEGQRRYIESLSAYARQFLDQMERPDVEAIDGLSPTLSIEQRSIGRSPRSTVGTATEISDYLRLLFARGGDPLCPECGEPIAAQSASEMTDRILALEPGTRIQVMAPMIRGRKGAYRKELENMRRRGYVHARIDGEMRQLDDEIKLARQKKHDIDLVIDRVIVKEGVGERLFASIDTALDLADGLVVVHIQGRSRDTTEGDRDWLFSSANACAECGISLPEIAPRLFSFNSPAGACPDCDGLGERHSFDPERVVPDVEAPLMQAIEPWQRKRNRRYYAQILKDLAEDLGVELDTPWQALPETVKKALLEGKKGEVSFSVGARPTRTGQPRKTRVSRTWGGVLDELERRNDSQLARYQTARTCDTCAGSRLRAEARNVHVGGRAIHELSSLSIGELRAFLDGLKSKKGSAKEDVTRRIVTEIRERLMFLEEVGLTYLTLDRPSRSLSGGEAQRIRLATQIGSSLRGVLYILDEPSIGLHIRDNQKLLESLLRLRDHGNSVLVVEHDEATIKAADQVIDMGPGAGVHGGRVVSVGNQDDLIADPASPTGSWLGQRETIPVPPMRRTGSGALLLRGCPGNNLKNVDLDLPLGTLTVVSGVSGSGKSTLITETLHRILSARLHGGLERPAPFTSLEGEENIDKVTQVDQAPIGRTPRSNAATYTGAFGAIRQIFSQVPLARTRGYDAGRFSFNVAGGRCEACEGAGQLRVEMHFLPDLFVTCEVCDARRYNRETLEIRYKGRTIADVLEMTVEEGLTFMENVPSIRRALQALCDVGLGYLRIGQPATTLSGGEAQRVKLARELAKRSTGRTLYLLDEPTTGLHLSDVRKLIELLQRLVDKGNTVLVIEHHLDVIKSADHVIDLGPEGGEGGGEILASGPPEEIAKEPRSHTGQALAPLFSAPPLKTRPHGP
ncbi:MAG: excinuclease ABC subunit UvrA [Myxococcota bacterium]|nr:excinuclease ABC subunit UvrA [Myxococcota bacterium]